MAEGYKAALDENGREIWYSCSDAYRYSGAYPGLEAEERGQGETIMKYI
jgi:hypothetical protein